MWLNPHQFWASHTEHHKYTLHLPDDLEVVLQANLTITKFFLRYIIDPLGFCIVLYSTVKMACGKPLRPWDKTLFLNADPAEKRRWVNWSRFCWRATQPSSWSRWGCTGDSCRWPQPWPRSMADGSATSAIICSTPACRTM